MLTTETKEFLLHKGIDLVGVAPAEALNTAPEGHRPTDYLPGAKSVIVMGYALNKGAVKNLPKSRNEYMLEYEQANSILNRVGHQGTRWLEKKGYISMLISAEASIGDRQRLKADLSLKHAAAAAGLGLFGINNLVLTPEFGARVRYGVILTEADLISDPLQTEQVCNQCGLCVKNCPVGALDEWEKAFHPLHGWRMNKEKCYHHIFVILGERRCGMCIKSCPKSNK